jgi:hypothetical protein
MGQPMHAINNKIIETYEEEKVAPPMVREVAPPVAQVQREKVAP